MYVFNKCSFTVIYIKNRKHYTVNRKKVKSNKLNHSEVNVNFYIISIEIDVFAKAEQFLFGLFYIVRNDFI
jgi:hypothetical protein